MAIFNETKITKLGHELLAKVLSGQCKLHFDELWAGDGYYHGDVWDLTDLVNPRLQGSIISVKPMGIYTELEGLITNQKLTSVMQFRELGVKAIDPDHGLILFSYTNAGDDVDYIGPFNGFFLTEEQFTMKIYTANVAEITATIETSIYSTQIIYNNTSSGLDSTNIQDAIDELNNDLEAHNQDPDAHPDRNPNTRIATVSHGLGVLPLSALYCSEYGYGIGGYGEGPYGGTDLTQIPVKLVAIDRNTVHVYAPAKYAGFSGVSRLTSHSFALSKTDSTTTLTLVLR